MNGLETPCSDTDTPVVTLDYDLYEHYLENAGLTERQKQEYLQALWTIICSFVDLGYGVHPAQMNQINCGKTSLTANHSGPALCDHLDFSVNRMIKEFVSAATYCIDDAGDGIGRNE